MVSGPGSTTWLHSLVSSTLVLVLFRRPVDVSPEASGSASRPAQSNWRRAGTVRVRRSATSNRVAGGNETKGNGSWGFPSLLMIPPSLEGGDPFPSGEGGGRRGGRTGECITEIHRNTSHAPSNQPDKVGERDGFLTSPLRRSTRTFPTRTALEDASDATRNQTRSFKGRRNQKTPSVPYDDARILPFAFKTVVRRIINAQEKGNDRHWRRMKSVGRRKHRPESRTLRTVDSCLRHRSLEKVHQMCLEINARIARNDP